MQLGTRLGPYEIVAPIGAGGMGEVYRARDTRYGRGAAVKAPGYSLVNLFTCGLTPPVSGSPVTA
jgi:hypothetical protein